MGEKRSESHEKTKTKTRHGKYIVEIGDKQGNGGESSGDWKKLTAATNRESATRREERR